MFFLITVSSPKSSAIFSIVLVLTFSLTCDALLPSTHQAIVHCLPYMMLFDMVVWITSKLMGYQSFLYSLYHNMADYMHPYRAFNSLRYSILIPFSICKFFFCSEFTSHMMSTNSTSIFNIMNFLLACQR